MPRWSRRSRRGTAPAQSPAASASAGSRCLPGGSRCLPRAAHGEDRPRTPPTCVRVRVRVRVSGADRPPTCVAKQARHGRPGRTYPPISRGWPRLEAALSLLWRWRGVLQGGVASAPGWRLLSTEAATFAHASHTLWWGRGGAAPSAPGRGRAGGPAARRGGRAPAPQRSSRLGDALAMQKVWGENRAPTVRTEGSSSLEFSCNWSGRGASSMAPRLYHSSQLERRANRQPSICKTPPFLGARVT